MMVAHIKNASRQPVYDLTDTWTYSGDFRSNSERLKPLMPDEENINIELMRPSDDLALFSVTAVFRDADRVRWLSHPGGEFDEVPEQADV